MHVLLRLTLRLLPNNVTLLLLQYCVSLLSDYDAATQIKSICCPCSLYSMKIRKNTYRRLLLGKSRVHPSGIYLSKFSVGDTLDAMDSF